MARMSRVVVVTGASSGVGRACVRAFAAAGDDVALIARSADALKQAALEVEAEGSRALVLPLDVADPDEVERAASEIERELGPIDVWVNDAMVSVYSPVLELHEVEVARVTAVNYLGTVHGTLAALRRMAPRDAGTIVQVGSGLAYRAIPLQAAYCASKHAIRGFTESVRTELLHERSAVRITMVQLPGLNTPHFTRVRSRMPRAVRPVAPIYTPELAARTILRAADRPRREHIVAGWNALMLAGQRIAPGLLDRYLGLTGVDSQMTEEPIEPRDGNLFETLPGDPGVSGAFAALARDRALPEVITSNPATPIIVASTAFGAAAVVLAGRRRSRVER
jgi:short-subunit dehydrogenase